MVKFIGEDGFYPKWATENGRWVLQRVFTTVRGLLEQIDTMSRPSISHEVLVWVPKARNPLHVFNSGNTENSNALRELQLIPLTCSRCDWKGRNPNIEGLSTKQGANNWRLRCPECQSLVEPDLDSVDWSRSQEFLLTRWDALGRPHLDNPGAASSMKSIAPIVDLGQWMDRIQPQQNELVYIGQQLWPSFAEFMADLQLQIAPQSTSEKNLTNSMFTVLCVDATEPKITCVNGVSGRADWSYVNDKWNFAAPTAQKGVVYFGSGDGSLTALNVSDGSLVWKTPCPETVITRPCFKEQTLFVGCNDGFVVAMSTQTGEIKWSSEPIEDENSIEQILESSGVIVVHTYDGLFGLALDDGHIIWNTSVPPESKIHATGSLIIGGATIDDLDIEDFWAIDAQTGTEAWSYRLPKPATAYTVEGQHLFYVTDSMNEDNLEPCLVILGFEDSKSSEIPIEVEKTYIAKDSRAEELLVYNGLLFGVDLALESFCFDLSVNRLIWFQDISAMYLHGIQDSLLFVSDTDKLMAVDVATGKVAWTYAGVREMAVSYEPEPSA